MDVQSAGNGGGMDRIRGLISRLSGGGTPAINKALEQHHAQVMADAQRHAQTAKQYYGMVAKARATGVNPTTGKPVTPEELQQWQQMADGAWADYTKIAGKSKQAKPIIQQMGGLLKHITGGGGGGGTQGSPQPGSSQGGASAAPGGASQQGGKTVAPPPGAGGNPLQEAAEREYLQGAEKEQDALRAEQAKTDIASKSRIAEKEAEAESASKAKQAEREAEIKATSEARLAEEAARHKSKMAEIDETAKVRAAHDTRRTTASSEDKFQQALEKSDYVAARKEVAKAQSDYDGALDRQKTMHQNLDAGLKGDQQAMLSLVANHIGMTLGAQKGARITRAVWDEATQSTPLLARLEAKFDSRGYLSGVTLTPDQMRQMVELADQKVGILKDHTDRVQSRYAQELSVKRGGTVAPPPDSTSKRIKVTAEDMANAK